MWLPSNRGGVPRLRAQAVLPPVRFFSSPRLSTQLKHTSATANTQDQRRNETPPRLGKRVGYLLLLLFMLLKGPL